MKLVLVAAGSAALGCEVSDFATPEESARREGLVTREEAGDAEAGLEREELDRSIAERFIGGVIDWVDAFVPVPLQPWKTQLVALVLLMAFPRSREHLGKTAKGVAKMDLRGAVMSALRSIGLLHTSADPVEVMRGAAAAARARGDEELALEIEAKAKELAA